ncbi:MAG: alpha/beta hydrolase, partial [Rhodococcus sp. (in: high G+C Gram-positive bacteria)]|nr:alpha/beta hydrolase [Rhodococcus sp. (in: high G+C Gram-positive bacteria)]
PFRDDPIRFVRVVEEFLGSTAPAEFDEQRWGRLLVNGAGERRITGGPATRQAVLGAMGADERSAT